MMRTILVIAALAILFPLSAFAQQGDKKPAAEAKGAVEATVVEIKGVVDVKRPADKDWTPAAKDMKLPEGSEVCTGFDSSAILLFQGETKVDVLSLSNIKVDKHAMAGKNVNTSLNVQFGQIELDVKKGDIKADIKVSTPNSTTSISGTRLAIRAFSDMVPRGGGANPYAAVRVYDGTVGIASNSNDVQFSVGGGEATTQELALPHETVFVFMNTALPPLIGATNEELGTATNTNTTFDMQTIGFLGGELTSGSSPTGDRIIQQQEGLLPGPPPPPGGIIGIMK